MLAIFTPADTPQHSIRDRDRNSKRMINKAFGVTAWLLSVLLVGLPSLLVPVAHANDTHAQLELAVQEFLLQELATAERTTTLVPPYSQATVSMTLPPAGLPCDNPQLSLPNRQQRFLGRVSVAATCGGEPAARALFASEY